MMETNVCPYCGGTNIEAIRSDIHNNKKVPHQPNVHHYARCADCRLRGPYVQAEDDVGHWYYSSWQDAEQAAISAFCHPAHLHTYAPGIEMKVNRKTMMLLNAAWAGIPLSELDRDRLGREMAELRAALEGK